MLHTVPDADLTHRDRAAIARHVAYLTAEEWAVSVGALLPDAGTVTVWKDGRVERSSIDKAARRAVAALAVPA